MRNPKVLALAASAAAALALTGCGATISKAPVSGSPTSFTPAASPSPSATATTAGPLTGPAGTTFTVTASDSTSYTVTLDQVSQDVTPGEYESPEHAGDHFAAAQFTITGKTGSASDDANSDADAIGSDDTEYQPTFLVNSLPNFSSGTFNVGPGQSVKGWVAFELPSGVTVASVQWAPGLGGQAATWTLGS